MGEDKCAEGERRDILIWFYDEEVVHGGYILDIMIDGDILEEPTNCHVVFIDLEKMHDKMFRDA
ncbi:hypothetical protein Lal_00034068 [Lupinus albus]|nr:hypothetical protein Lal_00034068 [Lupinus albus]